jgi:hypothetical protein
MQLIIQVVCGVSSGNPESSIFLQLIQDQQWSYHNITTFGTKILYIGVQKIYNNNLQLMFKYFFK